MPIVLAASFIFYSLLSWVLLFRDSWTLEVLSQKFYPEQAVLITQIQNFLSSFKLNTVPTLVFFIFILIAFWAYFLAWRKKFSPRKILFVSFIFQVIVFFSYPILSTDVLSYILSDRIAVIYHQNVWTTKPNVFAHDPYYYLVYPIYAASDWTNQTRIYGPVNQAIYSAVTAVSGNDFLINLAAHKFVVLIFNLGTMVLVYKILKKYFPDKLNFGLIFVFWNPLFILETVGSGHNDILMIFFIILSYLFFLQKRPLLVAVSLALAVNVKSAALLLAPIYIASFFGRQISSSIKFGIFFVICTLTLFATMGTSLFAVITRTLFSTTLYWQSFPQQLSKIFPIAIVLLTPVFILLYLFQCLRGWLAKKDPLVLYGQIYLFYLLFTLGAYWNWYSLWVLTAFAFLGKGRWSKIAGALTFTSALTYPLYWLSLRFNYQHPLWPVIIYTVILSGPVIAYLRDKKN